MMPPYFILDLEKQPKSLQRYILTMKPVLAFMFRAKMANWFTGSPMRMLKSTENEEENICEYFRHKVYPFRGNSRQYVHKNRNK